MCMQRQKAEDARIRLFATFENIHDGMFDIRGMHSPIINADEQRIKQVLLNLQSNALKFTDKRGKVEIRIAITENHQL